MSASPIWLDIKKEYIDDNFEPFLAYLRSSGQRHDEFYDKTVSLLSERAAVACADIVHQPLHEAELPDAEACRFNARLLAAYLLLAHKDTARDCRATLLALLAVLRCLAPKFSKQLLELAVRVVNSKQVEHLGYDWSDIITFQPETFAYKTLQYTRMVSDVVGAWHTGRGSVLAAGNNITLFAEDGNEAKRMLDKGVASLELQAGIRVLTDTDDRIKESQRTNIVAINAFTVGRLNALRQQRTAPKAPAVKLKYADGDEVDVRITRLIGNEIQVETISPRHETICGKIVFELKSIIYYYADTFASFFRKGDIIPVKIVSAVQGTFSLKDTFIRYVIEDCRADYEDDICEFAARKIDDNQKNSDIWLTDRGTPIYTGKAPEYSRDSYAYVTVDKFATGSYYGIIYGHVSAAPDADCMFDLLQVRRDCIHYFTRPEAGSTPVTTAPRTAVLPVELLSLLLRHVFAHHKNLLRPSDRATHLAVARLLAEMTADTAAADYIDFTQTYLRTLVLFTRGESIQSTAFNAPDDCRDTPAAKARCLIVRLLSMWGKPDDDNLLPAVIAQQASDSPMLARMAQLIQAANSIASIVTGATLNVLKRELIKTLSLETENDTDLEGDNSEYLGIESGSIEFKTSVCFPPDNNMQPDEHRQIRNVLRGVCAFLNSTSGGTLYIGVTDQGYVKGLETDMRFLHLTELDTYVRYHIQDPAIRLLGAEAVSSCVKFEPMYEGNVVAVRVEPYQYGIVELEGKAYLRVGAESREMNDTVRRQVMDRKGIK